MVTRDRECLLGEVVGGEVHLGEFGEIVREEWVRTGTVRPYVTLDAFVIMPNHIHGIVVITDIHKGMAAPCPYATRRAFGRPIANALSAIVGAVKSVTSRRVNALRQTPGLSVWQRNYHEHIIRNESDCADIRRYIAANPAQWSQDRENPIRA